MIWTVGQGLHNAAVGAATASGPRAVPRGSNLEQALPGEWLALILTLVVIAAIGAAILVATRVAHARTVARRNARRPARRSARQATSVGG